MAKVVNEKLMHILLYKGNYSNIGKCTANNL